jgi:hypothetical protein
MLQWYNDKPLLCDIGRANQTLQWYSCDDKKKFLRQPKRFQKQFNYDIEYKFNKYGHRTKDIEDLEEDFLLTFGCSYTEGIGLRTDQIWTHALKNHLNLDLYNCSKGATGMDIQYYNTTLWKTNKLPLPKLVIAQWPQKTRKMFASNDDDGYVGLRDMSETPTHDGTWWGRRYIIDTGELSLNSFMWYENFNNIWESLGVPVFNWTWDADIEQEVLISPYKLSLITPDIYDRARDYDHDGPGFHASTAEKLIAILDSGNFTYKV